MSEVGFTKGPWKWYHKKTQSSPVSLDNPDGYSVMEVDEYAGSCWIDITNHADYHLIAAAPDLYEALSDCLNYITNTESELGITLSSGQSARDALAKARGENP